MGRDDHYNHYLIQVTDGYVPALGGLHWLLEEITGTTNPLWGTTDTGDPTRGVFLEGYTGLWPESKATWSIIIEPSGVARLYNGPDATGSLLHEGILDLNRPWYVRFLLSDGTSGGFPPGDARFNLYDFKSINN